MKKIFLQFFLLLPLISFSQKNEMVLTHNSNIGGQPYSHTNSFGLRYLRNINGKLSVGVGFDYSKNKNPYYINEGYSINDIATNQLLYSKSISFQYSDKINSINFDVLSKYNFLNKRSKFNLSLILGATNQIIKYTYIPLLESTNYTITNQNEETKSKYYLLPKVGLSGLCKVYKNYSVGAEIYYRSSLLVKSNLIYTNIYQSHIDKTTITLSNGSKQTIGASNGADYSNIYTDEQTAFAFWVSYSF